MMRASLLILLLAGPLCYPASAAEVGEAFLIEECPVPKEGEDAMSERTTEPCHEYVKRHYESKSDLILVIRNGIDRQKDRARDSAEHNRFWNHIMSGTLIVLAFLTTFSAAIARTYRDEKTYGVGLRNVLGLAPIVVSALVTLVASFNAYYSFDDLRSKQIAVADELAGLQSRINFELIQRVSDGTAEKLEVKQIDGWRKALADIMAGSEKTAEPRTRRQELAESTISE